MNLGAGGNRGSLAAVVVPRVAFGAELVANSSYGLVCIRPKKLEAFRLYLLHTNSRGKKADLFMVVTVSAVLGMTFRESAAGIE